MENTKLIHKLEFVAAALFITALLFLFAALIVGTTQAQDTLKLDRVNTHWADDYSKLTQFDYLNVNGVTLAVGDTISLGYPSAENFEYVIFQRWLSSYPAPQWFSHVKMKVLEIRMCKGRANIPSLVLGRGEINLVVCNIRNALLTGELLSPLYTGTVVASRQVK